MRIAFDLDKIQAWNLSEYKPGAFPVFQAEHCR
jgi:hypothetical protein